MTEKSHRSICVWARPNDEFLIGIVQPSLKYPTEKLLVKYLVTFVQNPKNKLIGALVEKKDNLRIYESF